jgi:outer membrane receptor for ferrienterochelin and colicin
MIVNETIKGNTYGMIGGYVNAEWRPIDKLLLIPGIRYDYFPELDYNGSLVPAFWDYGIIDNRRGGPGEPALRVSGRYDLTDEHTVKAAVGTYSQSPEPYGMVIHETYGEPDLAAVKATHYVLGHEWKISELWHLDAQGYYNYMWDVARSYNSRIDYDPARQVQRKYFSDGHNRNYGLELMLRHSRSEKFFGWISYTLSRSETWNYTEDKYVLSSNDEPHHLQLLGSWRFPKNWEFGVRTRFVSGKPTSPIIATVENESGKSTGAVYGERNTERNDPFFQVDLRVDKKKIYKKWIMTYYVDLQNVLWPIYKSPEFTYYNYNYTESRKISMIPLAAFGIRAEF